jgi:hypothetical protein
LSPENTTRLENKLYTYCSKPRKRIHVSLEMMYVMTKYNVINKDIHDNQFENNLAATKIDVAKQKVNL